MMSALRLLGSTNCSCIGFTVLRYWFTTLSRLRPLSRTSRIILLSMRTSASVSTYIFMSICRHSSLQEKMSMPSTITTFAGFTVTVLSERSCTV